jgi:ribonuclease HII
LLEPYFNSHLTEAGCDEAGRGCLAGPVVAAAVILPRDFKNDSLNDSKQISEKLRYRLRAIILSECIDYGVAFIDNQRIDECNILNASIEAMHGALSRLKLLPEHIIVDGNRFKPYHNIPYTCIIKGDSKYMSIAAASILAKTFRDDYMQELHLQYPIYDWGRNKGYPVIKHREAIEIHGVTPYHRKTFRLVDGQSKLNFE